MSPSSASAHASANGHAADAPRSNGGPVSRVADAPPARSLGRLGRALAGAVQRRIPAADLDERDPDFIRDNLPWLWLMASIYYRGEVRGLSHIPETGPVLLVGNHSGGNMTPDTGVFTIAFAGHFGVERHFYQLAHNLVVTRPGLGLLRKFGTIAASPENARRGARVRGGAARLSRAATTRSTVRRGRARRSTSIAARASCGSRSSSMSRSSRSSRSADRKQLCFLREASTSPELSSSTRCSDSRSCRSPSPCRGA